MEQFDRTSYFCQKWLLSSPQKEKITSLGSQSFSCRLYLVSFTFYKDIYFFIFFFYLFIFFMQVVYFTATFPYLVLIILLVRGLLLDGHKEGIEFYITPKTDRLSDSVVSAGPEVINFFSYSR